MKFPKRLTKCLNYHLDLSTFYVLDVIPRKGRNTVVLIVPKLIGEHSYCGILLESNQGHWYPSSEQMLDAAVKLGYISGLKRVLLRHRCKRIYGK